MILLLYGAGGTAREIYDMIMRDTPNRWESIYFIDDFADEGPCYLSESIHFDSIAEKFQGKTDQLEGIVTVGEPAHRELLYHKLKAANIKITTLIDKSAVISPTASVGPGSIIFEMVRIHANVQIGPGVLIQPHCIIGHDIKIGAHSVISAFATPAGNTVVGKRVFLGMHATVKEKLTIGDDAIISMSAAVFQDLKPGVTVVGNPARVTKGNTEHKVF